MTDSTSSEVQMLRRCTRDIVAISALPAIWAAQAPAQIVGSLAEVLSDTLGLELAFVRMNEPGGHPFEIAYSTQGFLTDERVGQVARSLEPRLKSDLRIAIERGVPDPLGQGSLQLAVISLGPGQRLGVLAVGAKRETFPLETERLVLNAAANQAAIVLERKWAELALKSSQQQRAALYEREQRRSQQLHRLARASLAINSAPSLIATVQLITEAAREVIGCHQAFIRLSRDADGAEPSSPGFPGATTSPLPGELAVPLMGRNGKHLGLLHLSGSKEDGFSEDDEVIVAQLAQTAAIAIENVDLYEEAKKERDLAEFARAQLRLVSDTLPALVSYVDPSRTFRFVNAEYERWFGKPPHEIIGTRLEDLVGKENARLQAPYLQAVLSGQRVGCELLTPHQDGRPRETSLTYLPDLDPNGRVKGFVMLIQDISEQKRVEQALREAVRTRDEFLSIASHELKTPITSLKMQLQLTQRKIRPEEGTGIPPDKLARVLAISTRQLDRLTNLVEDLLDVSRIQAGKLEFRFETVDLSSLIHEVVERLRDQLNEARCPVEVVATETLEVECDRFRIEQVVVNLLTNVMKYGAGHPVKIAVESLRGAARISVRDFGIGIDKDKHEMVFERFARAVPSRNISGLGLGLYIVKQILNAHHGQIRVDSEVGKGSSFIVELPLNQPTEASMPVTLHAVR